MTKYPLSLVLTILTIGGGSLMASNSAVTSTVHCPQKEYFMQNLTQNSHINAPGRGATVWAPSQDRVQGQPVEFTLDLGDRKNLSTVNDLKNRLVGLNFQGATSVQNPDGSTALQCNYTYNSPEGLMHAKAVAPLPNQISTVQTAPSTGNCIGEHCYFEVTQQPQQNSL